MKQFRLPDPGEGLVEAEIVTWHVAVGDQVAVNDIIVDIETSKSIVELPSPYAGTIVELLVAEGMTVDVGTPIVVIDDGDDDAIPAEVVDVVDAPATAPEGQQDADSDESGPMLVGYGAKGGSGRRRRRAERQPSPATSALHHSYNATHPPGRRADEVTPMQKVEAEPTGAPLPGPGKAARGTDVVLVGEASVLAKPPVRKLAKDLGVDLSSVTPTGLEGRITREDVQAAAALQQPQGYLSGSVGGPGTESPGSSQGGFAGGSYTPGQERRVPIRGVRKLTAEKMVEATSTAVHVTEWMQVDVTETMALLETLKARHEFAGLRISPLLLYAKAVCLALGHHPDMNASWDDENQEIVYHGDVNLGVAAATPRGLLVPNIKAAQRMNLLELCQAINQLVVVAKEGRTQPADTSHGTFTITNVGVFGVDAGTPILNTGESGILCMGAIERRPWVMGRGADERIEPRWVTTLTVAFDHRLVDGEQGSRFLADVASILREPSLGMLF